MLFIALLFGVPLASVNAGFFSFVSTLFDKGNTKAVATLASSPNVSNSQTLSLLKAALHSDPNPSKGGGDVTIVGDSALLSETGPSGTLADIEDALASDQISIYVVREGDSLSQIAKMFGVSINTIIWANDIKRGSLIREGQTLIILPITGVRHIVKEDETLGSIVKKYEGSLEEVMQYNGFSDDIVLAVGDVVLIPHGEMEAPVYSGSTTVVRGTGVPTYSGYYLRPITGGRKSQGLHGYNGVDLATSAGMPILASAAGTVIISRNYGWNGGYGNYIVITHPNGTQTLYAHNNQNIVFVGQSVVQGQVIGYVGSTGRSTGPHVHFEVRGAANPF